MICVMRRSPLRLPPGPLLCLVGMIAAGQATGQDSPAPAAPAVAAPPVAAPSALAPAPAAAPPVPAPVLMSPAQPESDPPSDPQVAAVFDAGKKLFLKNCRTCHGSKGTAGLPLNGNPKVAAGPDYLVWAIITGPGYMPEFGPALSDDEIAAIATYIENTWGNSYGLVAPEDVAAVR